MIEPFKEFLFTKKRSIADPSSSYLNTSTYSHTSNQSKNPKGPLLKQMVPALNFDHSVSECSADSDSHIGKNQNIA